MSIIDIVKKNVKPIIGVVAGLGIAGASVYGALHGNDEDDYDCEVDEVIDFSDDDAEEATSEETADEAE